MTIAEALELVKDNLPYLLSHPTLGKETRELMERLIEIHKSKNEVRKDD